METQKADPNSKQSKKRAAAASHNETMRAKAVEGSDRPTNVQVEELERISKKLFKSSSKWIKMLRSGTIEQVTEEVTEYVPAEGDKPEEMKKHQVPTMYKSKTGVVTKIPLSTLINFTPETLMEHLKEKEKQYDSFLAKMKELQEEDLKNKEEERKNKEQEALAKKVQEQAGGSTLG